jgi:nucleotide-binding universal stress UspA family protein
MLKRMLVGLNGSEYSLAAMDEAIELAQAHQAALVGLGVVDVPHLTAPEPVPVGGGAFKKHRDATVVEAAHRTIDQALAGFSERCQAAGLSYHSAKLIGDPAAILVREVQRCDLLIVGKKHMLSEEWERASHTLDQILRRTPRPVLCVPAMRASGNGVLVAYDGSLQAARALAGCVSSGLAVGRELHVFSGGDDAQEHAGLAADFLRAHGLAPLLHVEEKTTQLARRILEIAGQIQARVIVLGSHGKSQLKEFFFGSVARAMLRDGSVPLWLDH